MKYFKVVAKCGHVGKNKFFKGTLFIEARSGKEAAQITREYPRVKHDQKNAILSVEEINRVEFYVGKELNKDLHYYSCTNIQEQRVYFSEIEQDIYVEDWIIEEPKKYSKKHNLRKTYNNDPDYESCKKFKYVDLEAA